MKRKRFWYRMLSWWRFLAAAGILAVFLRVYTSPLRTWSGIRSDLMSLQFTGALMSGGLGWIAVFAGLFAAGLLGRWYCSVLCPFGTLQEVVWRAAGILSGGRRRTRYILPWRFRGVVSILAGIGFLFSVPPLFISTDPISNFGRGVRGVHVLFSEGFDAGAGAPVWGMIAFFLLVLVFSAARGRRFCDWCPVGTLLGVCSRVSFVKMRLRKDVCVSCGACERVCPANCVDAKNKTLDGDRCILCLSCAGHCVTGALDYRSGGAGDGVGKDGRRAFLRGGGFLSLSAIPGLLYLAGAVSAFRAPGRKTVYEFEADEPETRRLLVVLPPGAGDIGSFFARCVGCQACAAACPTGIIRADGSPHPRLDYKRGYCQYNCTECAHVCPTHALHPLGEDKRRTRIGLSELTRPRCVVITRGQSCGACAEVCPTHALRMEPLDARAALTAPVFDSAYCIGCGGCFNVCPAEPRAFAVAGVTPQILTPGVRAAEPEETAVPLPLGAGDDFPF